MRIIDADALFEPNESTDKVLILGRNGGKTIALAEKMMRERVKMAPTLTLDELRPKGRWIVVEEGPMSTHTDCSVCDEEALSYWDEGYNKRMYFLTPSCPFCGADMRGGGEDA